MKKLMFAAMVAAVSGALMAEDAATDAAPAEATAVADGGVTAVQDGQDTVVEESAEFKSAEDILRGVMAEKGWEEGWDEEKGRVICVVKETFTDKNPATSKDFYLRREAAAKRCALEAKAQIIEMINTQMSGEDQLDIPGKDVGKELSAERDKVFAEVEAKRQALLALLAKTNKAEADALAGATFGMRMDDMLCAIIKKLDAEYAADKHDDALKARYEELKKQCAQIQSEYDALAKHAESLKQIDQTQTSKVAQMAKMPLFGATAVLQSESWDKTTGEYQVAVVFTWSKALEKAVRAIVTGEDFKTKPGKASVGAWLRKQDLAAMIGPRQYIDDKGNRWFLGITARSVSGLTNVRKKKATGLVDMFAKQMAVFSIYSDVESYKEAQQMIETRGDDDISAEDFAQKLSAKFEKKTIRGLQKLTSKEVKDPITGLKIYVAVWGLNANSAKAALETERRLYATKVEDERHQSVERGRRMANEAAVSAAKNRADDVNAGAAEQTTAIVGELRQRKDSKKTTGSQGSVKATTPSKARGGVKMSNVDVDDNF